MSQNKKILVTGGAGFIGSFLVDRLVEDGHEVTVFDNLDPQVHPEGDPPDYFNPQAKLVRGDVRDYETFKKAALKYQVIYHLAAAVGVGQSQYEIRHYVDVNTGGTANLLDILVNNDHSVEKLVVAASMSSYGEGCYRDEAGKIVRPELRPVEQMQAGQWEPVSPLDGGPIQPVPTPETAEQKCNSIYAITKKDQEDMLLNIGRTYDIPSVALRFFNVYGPRQSLSNPYTGVAAIFMSRIKNGKPPVIYEDGGQTRDFISVHDIVDALVLVMERPEADYQVFNLGTGEPLTIEGVARTLAKVFGSDVEPEITEKFRKGDVRHCYADISKIKQQLGWAPKVSFEQGMRELIEWSRLAEADDKFDQAAEELKKKGIV
jgi:dTDP-L-rhamnose 4-epimerase